MVSRVGIGALLACGLAASLTVGASYAARSTSATSSVVPLDLQFSPAPTPVTGEGQDHLLYEMRLTNFSGRAITLKSIDVLNEATGEAIARHASADLASMIGAPGRKISASESLTIPAGSFVVVHFDTICAAGACAGVRLRHVIRIEGPAGSGDDEARTKLISAPLRVGDARPLVLEAPLTGSGWLAANALSNTADHRRTIAVVNGQARIAQRYAIDFVKLDKQGRAFVGEASRNTSWVGYGAPILAVTDGIVEAIRDGIPDNQPLAASSVKVDLDTIGGNHVVLELPGGQHIFYGHLKPGSILVQRGQKVKRGEVLAAVGNSGQSDAPHLHLHVANAASALGADGLAFVFDHFGLEGHVPSLAVLESPEGWRRNEAVNIQKRHKELPLENAVIDFSRERQDRSLQP